MTNGGIRANLRPQHKACRLMLKVRRDLRPRSAATLRATTGNSSRDEMDSVIAAADSALDRSAPASRPPVIVGRERERAVLREELAAAVNGDGRFVLLTGEAGIGKTALAYDLAGEAQAWGVVVAVGRCFEASGTPAFAPWHELLAALPAVASDAAPLPPPFDVGAPAQTAYQLMRTVTAHLNAVAVRQPVMLLLDDLHWADRDTLELLDVVTRSLAAAPLLVLATYRPEALDRAQPLFDLLPRLQRDRPLLNADLGNLGIADAASLVETSCGPCHPELAAYLHARSDGHTLFLVELLRDLSERQLLPCDETGRFLPPVQIGGSGAAAAPHQSSHRPSRRGGGDAADSGRRRR